MKKILSIFLVLSMLAASMAACSGDTTNEDTSGDTTPAVEDTTPAGEDTTPADTEAETDAETEAQTEAETDAPVEDVVEKEGYVIEQMDEWHAKAHECTFVDGDGNIRGSSNLPEAHYENDKFAEWIEANPEWYKDTAMMSAWDKVYAPFGDCIDSFIAADTEFISDLDNYQGLTIFKTFNLTDVSETTLYELYCFYDNSVYIYINGEPVYIHDNHWSGTSDWTSSYVLITPNQDPAKTTIRDYLKEGENTIAISVKDCWGGRELDAYLWYQLDSTKRDVYMLETGADWNAIALSCPYTDGEGTIDGGAAGGFFDEATDEFKKYITEHADFTTDYATAESWPVYTANLSDGTEGLGWVGGVHGLIAHTAFEVSDLADLKTCDEWKLYGNYDNAVHVYLNGVEIYVQDGECVTQDWASGEWILDEATIEGAIVEGTNHLVVTLKDAWGGRGMNLGLYCHWN